MTADLYRVIRKTLLEAGCFHEDAGWIGGLLTRRIDAAFTLEAKPQEEPIDANIRADLEEIARELVGLDDRDDPEYTADYLYGRLAERYRFGRRVEARGREWRA